MSFDLVDFVSIGSQGVGGNPLCASSATVRVVTDDDAILAHLSVPELFRQVEAQHPGTVEVMGALALVGGRGHVHFVAGHESFRLN